MNGFDKGALLADGRAAELRLLLRDAVGRAAVLGPRRRGRARATRLRRPPLRSFAGHSFTIAGASGPIDAADPNYYAAKNPSGGQTCDEGNGKGDQHPDGAPRTRPTRRAWISDAGGSDRRQAPLLEVLRRGVAHDVVLRVGLRRRPAHPQRPRAVEERRVARSSGARRCAQRDARRRIVGDREVRRLGPRGARRPEQ